MGLSEEQVRSRASLNRAAVALVETARRFARGTATESEMRVVSELFVAAEKRDMIADAHAQRAGVVFFPLSCVHEEW